MKYLFIFVFFSKIGKFQSQCRLPMRMFSEKTIVLKSIFYKEVGGKNLHELSAVTALFQKGNFCNFLPPPNFHVFSYNKLTLII